MPSNTLLLTVEEQYQRYIDQLIEANSTTVTFTSNYIVNSSMLKGLYEEPKKKKGKAFLPEWL